ncbi:hypothetical protein [Coleofasciculus sp.]|uniref:hypothetical protein n=1 Tax=Coleofasciculus sp. TaxID=3100458 RepID=UPI003A1ECA2B
MKNIIWLTLVILYISVSMSDQLEWLNFLILVFLHIYMVLGWRSDDPEFTQKVVAIEERLGRIQVRLTSLEKEIDKLREY